MKHPFLFILLLFLAVSCSESSSIQLLHDQDKVENDYHLYASTLRMLNFQDVESYNKLVKDIEKLSLIKMRTDSFGTEEMLAFSNKLQNDEGYEPYLEVTDTERQYYILGKESPDKTMVLLNHEGSQYIVDIEGQLNFLELPRLINSLSEIDSSETSGLSMFYDLINEDAEREKRRKKRREEWEERKRKEKEEMEFKRDSIARDSANLKLEPVLD